MSLGKIIRLDPSDYEKFNNIWDMKRHPDKAKLMVSLSVKDRYSPIEGIRTIPYPVNAFISPG